MTFWLRLWVAAVLLVPLSVPAAPSSAPLTVEQVIALRAVSQVSLSPDGQTIVFRMERHRTAAEGIGPPVGELWRIESRGGSPEKVADTGVNVRQPKWSTDGTHLAWIAQPAFDEPAQIYVMPIASRQVQRLPSAAGRVQALQWSPDARRIAYTAWDATSPHERAEQRAGRDWTVFESSPKQLRLYAIELQSQRNSLLVKDEASVHFFDWSPDGSRLVVGAAPGPGDDDRTLRTRPYLVAAVGSSLRLVAATVGKLTDPVWSKDGKWLAWLGSTAITDPAPGSVFVAAADLSGTPRNLTANFTGTAVGLAAMPGTADTFVFRSEEWQRTALRTVVASTGESTLLNSAQEILAELPSFSRDGESFAGAASTATHPDEVFLGTRRDSKALRRVTQSNASLSPSQLGAQSVFRWNSRDGTPIEGVLIQPPGFREGRKYPVVLHVHGGSESVVSDGWQGSFRNWGQLLAARGYLVLFPNYRGSRGRGVEFVAGNRRDMMGREWEDIESGLDRLIALGSADGERAGIYGFSWGGYAAGWGATYASHRFKAAVGGAGIYNWVSLAGSNDTRMHEQLAHWDAPLYENFGLYLQRSPIFEVRRAATPMLLLHGERDRSCPLDQAIEFHTALRWKGVPVELVTYPREGHGMEEYEHQRDFARRGLAWFDRYLAPATPP
ncbi:alpha/beta hydrolase family protein [Steroidobacter sp.]|uniref:alpha/beta hydrolase family protein n=1 Tax=Steroidobacter sp. TaxID=1978227 RepID=UPI001A5DA489|nr:S9 family peptidase [Steroidobacter sp.]MBL8267996.1 S9 family peptidase [Steroidobacter sp.]